MRRKLRKLLRRLEEAGAIVGVSPDIPDEAAELFIHGVMSCPDCAAAFKAAEQKRQGDRRNHHGH